MRKEISTKFYKNKEAFLDNDIIRIAKKEQWRNANLKVKFKYARTLKDSRVVSPRCHKNLDRFV